MTAGITDSALQARRIAAIETSGWGAKFFFLQPRNAAFWVYLAMMASGLLFVRRTLSTTGEAFQEAYMAALFSSFVFGAVFLLFLHHADRFERTPAKLAMAGFLIGGFGSTWAIAITGNAAVLSIYAKLFGQAWAQDWGPGLTAPFVEETAKGAAFLLLLALAPVVIRTVYDGLIVGAFVGLGFQIIEDVLYGANSAIANFGANQADSVFSIFFLRAATGISSHALYTAIFAAGVIYAVGTPAQPRRLGRGIALMLSAMLIHGVWDAAAALGSGTAWIFVIMFSTIAFSLVMLWVAIRWGAGDEHDFMVDLMRPEVENGTITEAELEGVAGRRRNRKAAVKHRPDGINRRRERHILAATRDLAHDLAESGGVETEQTEHSRREIARLRARKH